MSWNSGYMADGVAAGVATYPTSLSKKWLHTRQGRLRLKRDLLALLPSAKGGPVSTRTIGEKFELDERQRGTLLWRQLDQGVRDGLIERVTVPDQPCRLWRRTPAGDAAVEAQRDTLLK